MPFSLGGRWSRIATTLSLPTLTVVLAATSGCRSDGTARPAMSAMSPAKWFAREAKAEDDFELKPIPGGGYDTPPVPPKAPVGRAFIPAPAPAPESDAFYSVRPTGGESSDGVKPSLGEKVRELFRIPSKEASAPAEIQPISHQDFAPVMGPQAGQVTRASQTPPVPPRLIAPATESRVTPAKIAAHIEPIRSDRQPGRLPQIVARQFPMPAVLEPSLWPHGPAARMAAAHEARPIAMQRSADERVTFLPLPGDDVASSGPALLH